MATSSAPTTPTSGPPQPSVGELVKSATTDLSTLVRSEIELAKTELATSAKKAGISVGSFAAAGVLAAFAAVFFFITLAEFLTWLGLPRWIGYLIVFALLLVLVGLAALVGITLLKRVQKPERTLETLGDLPDVFRREAPGQRQHDLPTVQGGTVTRTDPHRTLG